jgi:hypothetical protein
MRVVTVAARDALRVHLALEERLPVVHLAALLTVGVEERVGEERWTVVVEQWLSGFMSFADLSAPRMALRAHVDFAFGGPGVERVAHPFINAPCTLRRSSRPTVRPLSPAAFGLAQSK